MLDANGGRGRDAQLSPKLSLAWLAADELDLYVNYGRGLHSNDVREATVRVDPATGEPSEGIADIHIHPFEPRSLRASVTMHF